MSKKVSVTELRNQLGNMLRQLEEGQSHFIIERNNQEVAVLLSMEKFRDIMQTLETLNSLDFIEAETLETLEQVNFPILAILSEQKADVSLPKAEEKPQPLPAPSSLEDVAARLGIRILK